MKKEKLHCIVYKTTNLINNKYYIGQHQTYNLNDTYLGSGKILTRAINKYGSENFNREILFNFDDFDEMNEKEKELVTLKEVKDPMCYNLMPGGQCNNSGMLSVKDKNGNNLKCTKDDPRYLSGEVVHCTKGKVTAKDIDGNIFYISINDPRYLSGELKHISCGTIAVKNKDGIVLNVSINDPRYLSGELVVINKGMVSTKDKTGKLHYISVKDPRYLSGELLSIKKNMITVKDKTGKNF